MRKLVLTLISTVVLVSATKVLEDYPAHRHFKGRSSRTSIIPREEEELYEKEGFDVFNVGKKKGVTSDYMEEEDIPFWTKDVPYLKKMVPESLKKRESTSSSWIPENIYTTSERERRPLYVKKDHDSSVIWPYSRIEEGEVLEEKPSYILKKMLHKPHYVTHSRKEEEMENPLTSSIFGNIKDSAVFPSVYDKESETRHHIPRKEHISSERLKRLEADRDKISVRVNNEVIKDFIEDFKDFGVTYWTETEDEREDVLDALKDAYANTAAKLILNFGKVVTPVAEEWADIMQYVQVNPMCDQKCAVMCLNPKRRDTMFFDQACLASCRCQFKIGELKHDKLRTKAHNLEESLDDTNEFFDRVVRKEGYDIVKPAIDTYLKKESKLHREFANLLRRHATVTFGCEEECLDDCLERPTFVSFWEIPMCIRHCKCSLKNVIDIEGEGRVNLPHVMRDSNYDVRAWDFFKKHGSRFMEMMGE